MTTLNRAASEAMIRVGATACTDVTGFGLLGHLHELARASGTAAQISADQVPVIAEALGLIGRGAISHGTRNNVRFLAEHVARDAHVTEEQRLILCDAQTSGGLLIAVPADKRGEMAAALERAGCLACAEIGHLIQGKPGRVMVTK